MANSATLSKTITETVTKTESDKSSFYRSVARELGTLKDAAENASESRWVMFNHDAPQVTITEMRSSELPARVRE